MNAEKSQKPEPKVNIFINQQKHEVAPGNLTPRQVLETLAKEDVTQVTLALKEQGQLHKYLNLDEPIPLRNGMHFIVMHSGPTPVS
ncbi:hypothetical protein QOL99_11045 [Deinococcus sp. MIMF12]|uniref:Multi-ubiquitin domain-containing protein n=1 Tax=Deinococcus rhizophilus TaxID=3049544 RepID=A0ABT7JHZ5_9DEIO|nr:hypothetical protein [Deinococcus rhizophilus]MDL2344683.1 hypothetical protein [Deinococcus rhizophilus]